MRHIHRCCRDGRNCGTPLEDLDPPKWFSSTNFSPNKLGATELTSMQMLVRVLFPCRQHEFSHFRRTHSTLMALPGNTKSNRGEPRAICGTKCHTFGVQEPTARLLCGLMAETGVDKC